MSIDPPLCGDAPLDTTSLNMHFHGTNTSPKCHADQVIKTGINERETFQYQVVFPANEPSGLYWYHPHLHGVAEHAVQGGASGAIVVDEIENIQPAVSGLRQRILMVRDQLVPGNPMPTGNIPSWDVSLIYITITSPTNPKATNFVPATANGTGRDPVGEFPIPRRTPSSTCNMSLTAWPKTCRSLPLTAYR